MKDVKGVAGKLESLSNSRPDDKGEWIKKVTSTELKVKSLADKIDDIEEKLQLGCQKPCWDQARLCLAW